MILADMEASVCTVLPDYSGTRRSRGSLLICGPTSAPYENPGFYRGVGALVAAAASFGTISARTWAHLQVLIGAVQLEHARQLLTDNGIALESVCRSRRIQLTSADCGTPLSGKRVCAVPIGYKRLMWQGLRMRGNSGSSLPYPIRAGTPG